MERAIKSGGSVMGWKAAVVTLDPRRKVGASVIGLSGLSVEEAGPAEPIAQQKPCGPIVGYFNLAQKQSRHARTCGLESGERAADSETYLMPEPGINRTQGNSVGRELL
ncbi:hypothetical protein NDU88_002834 [Pleurodeles waltl]|uniref:Uncharacterized protein n=1 Tax=Pleurodeles waltl TaxID=8319 RepID=A0AAV7NGF7_PLEWA|nr:hypothetical protein NDU88_002834 [Pleurodeles waltl]